MDSEVIKAKVQKEVIAHQYPDLAGIEPEVESSPSESRLRTLRRSRAIVSERDLREIPIEHRFTYRSEENDERPFDQTVVIVTDDEGETQFVIESR